MNLLEDAILFARRFAFEARARWTFGRRRRLISTGPARRVSGPISPAICHSSSGVAAF
jgi:hypothetical protein